MDVTPHELRDTEIREAFRGYQKDEVNELLERAAATIETQIEKIRLLTDRVTTMPATAPVAAAAAATGDDVVATASTRETEQMLHRTLLLAQRAADEAIAEAQQEAAAMVADAEQRSRSMIADAEAEVRRIGEVERRRVEHEVLELTKRRDALESDVDALAGWETEYRDRVARQLETDLAQVRGRGPTTTGPKPLATAPATPMPTAPLPVATMTTAPVDTVGALPAVTTTSAPSPSMSDLAAPPAARVEPPAAPEPPAARTEAPAVTDEDADVLRAAQAARTAPPAIPAVERGADVPTAPEPAPAPAPLAGSGAPGAPSGETRPGATGGRDSGTRRGANRGESAGTGNEPSEIDLRPEPGDDLDDDQFFATLRDAVRDDGPLGPSDDTHFESDHEPGFREIFKRRR